MMGFAPQPRPAFASQWINRLSRGILRLSAGDLWQHRIFRVLRCVDESYDRWGDPGLLDRIVVPPSPFYKHNAEDDRDQAEELN